MRASQTYLSRLTAVAFAAALGAVSASACAETVVTGLQATGAYLLDANAAASVFDSQWVPALISSVDTVLLPLAGFSTAVSRSDGSTHGHVSASGVSKSNDLDVLNVGGFTELDDEVPGFAEGSSFAAFQHVILETAFSLHDQWPDDSAAALTDVSRFGASLKLTDMSVAAMPEPSTYALMFGSMSIISSTARRRRNDAVGWMASRRREDVAP
jgi:hypothetical protein